MIKTRINTCFLSLAISLSGCAGTQSHLRLLERDGTIRTDIADDKTYDYKVLIENRFDIGWDGGNREDRIRTVNLMFQDNCKEVDIIDETPINKGQYLTGSDTVTWVMKVKCIK